MKQESWRQAKEAFRIESECILQYPEYLDEKSFSDAIRLLARAERIGTCGCGHSGIACMHFSHLLCCIERPSRFISPAEAPHGATGFLQDGDVMLFGLAGRQDFRASSDSGNLQEERRSCHYGYGEHGLSPCAWGGSRSKAIRKPGDR